MVLLTFIESVKNPYIPQFVFDPESPTSLKKLADFVFQLYLDSDAPDPKDDPIYQEILRGEFEHADEKLREQCFARFYEVEFI